MIVCCEIVYTLHIGCGDLRDSCRNVRILDITSILGDLERMQADICGMLHNADTSAAGPVVNLL
jgi:hypothetical protein